MNLYTSPKRIFQGARIAVVTCLLTISPYSSALRVIPSNPDWEEHRSELVQLDTYTASGKLHFSNRYEERSLRFTLSQAPNSTELVVKHQLFGNVLRWRASEEGTEVKVIFSKAQATSEPEELVKSLTGINIPITELPEWIKGLPTSVDGFGLNNDKTLALSVKILDGDLWIVEYAEYFGSGETELPLPRRINLEQGGNYIELEIDTWSI
ncbi:Outer membrane lipoprotein LolB precursor [Vibrio chagasii]|nr:Outer membrane lipoprotein LolB precursor [Vibrio chagasii]